MKKMILKGMIVLTLVTSFTGLAQCIEQISVGTSYMLVLDSKGYLWTGGRNGSGQLGDGTEEDKNELQKIGNYTWKQLAASHENSFAIRSDGTLWGWGLAAENRIGIGSGPGPERIMSPVQIGSDTDWKKVVSGAAHSLALKEDGTLWSWGVGDLSGFDTTRPVKISNAVNWKDILTTNSTSWVIKEDGSLWTWGNNHVGQLGIGSTIPNRLTAIEQLGLESDWEKLCSASAYALFCLAIKTDGTLWGWGKGVTEAGIDFESKVWTMQPVQIGTATDWKEVSVSNSHVLALKQDRSLWAVGKNEYGQLRDDSFTNTSQFIPTSGDRKWKAIGAGYGFSAAISEDNRLFTWGKNTAGQLVDGTLSDRPTFGEVGEKICLTLGSHDFDSAELRVYPIPADREITIDFGHLQFEAATVTVYNSLGQIVSQKTIQKQIERMPIEGVSGFYSVKIDFPDGETSIRKILKK